MTSATLHTVNKLAVVFYIYLSFGSATYPLNSY